VTAVRRFHDLARRHQTIAAAAGRERELTKCRNAAGRWINYTWELPSVAAVNCEKYTSMRIYDRKDEIHYSRDRLWLLCATASD